MRKERVRESIRTLEKSHETFVRAAKEFLSSFAGDDRKQVVKHLQSVNFYPRMDFEVNKLFESRQWRSYRFQRACQMGFVHNSRLIPPRILNVKKYGVDFAQRMGLDLPSSVMSLNAEDVDLTTPSVVKPMHSDGGKSVYAPLPKGDGRIEDLFSGRIFKSSTAFRDTLKSENLPRNKGGQWIQEEMVTGSRGSPRETIDVKFYCFYGSVALVLEVDRWGRGEKTFYDCSGVPCDTGRYRYRRKSKPLFTNNLLVKAEEVSKAIPWPHVRIDFLVSDVHEKFGEFTLRPGNPAGFNESYDRYLGELYAEANARLYEDLLMGKAFDEYKRVIANICERFGDGR